MLTTTTMGQDIVQVFLDVIQALFQGIATGIADLFSTLIYDATTGLTNLGTWMVIFMGFSFALTIFYALFRKVA